MLKTQICVTHPQCVNVNVLTQFWSEKLKRVSAWSMLCGLIALCPCSDYLALNNSELVMTGAEVLVAYVRLLSWQSPVGAEKEHIKNLGY
jgi:hypothetical protein